MEVGNAHATLDCVERGVLFLRERSKHDNTGQLPGDEVQDLVFRPSCSSPCLLIVECDTHVV
jgi:hypothetical protein